MPKNLNSENTIDNGQSTRLSSDVYHPVLKLNENS